MHRSHTRARGRSERCLHPQRGMYESRLPHEKHIHLPNAAVMARLLRHRGERSLSMYIPTTEGDEAVTKNRIRFKNALAEATDALRSLGASEAAIGELLKPLDGWADDDRWWAHQGPGLALFLHGGELEAFRLPASVEPRVLVGDRYHLLPLLQLRHASAPHYYVLCLEQSGPTLYASSTFSMDPLVMDFPSFEETVGHDTTERHTQGHSTHDDGGRWVFHGHGSGSDEEHKQEIGKYCRLIDERIRAYLPNDRTPLVVVAVEYVGAIYVSVSQHGNVVGRVDGNPGSFDRAELHRRAHEVADAKLREPARRDLEALQQAFYADRASAGVDDVLNAAADGRVEVLFLRPDERLVGEWDEAERSVVEAASARRSEHALMDRAAREVLDKGGRLRFVDGDALPSDEPLAAVLRY
jgi:hypothetical protein